MFKKIIFWIVLPVLIVGFMRGINPRATTGGELPTSPGIEFIPGTPEETPYLVATGGSTRLESGGQIWRFADGRAHFTYCFKAEKGTYARLILDIEQEYLVSVSTDNHTWTTVLNSEMNGNIPHGNRDEEIIDLTPLFRNSNQVYVKFEDSDPSGGYGPSLYKVTLDFAPVKRPDMQKYRHPGPIRFAYYGPDKGLIREALIKPASVDSALLFNPDSSSPSRFVPIIAAEYRIGNLKEEVDVVVLDGKAEPIPALPNKLLAFVKHGGALIVLGGPKVFGGTGSSPGTFEKSNLIKAMPVEIYQHPDFVKKPSTLTLLPEAPKFLHALNWEKCPPFESYNQVRLRSDAELLARWENGDPAMVTWKYGRGRVFVFTSSATGSWGKQVQTEWAASYRNFISGLIEWMAGEIPVVAGPQVTFPSSAEKLWRETLNEFYRLKSSIGNNIKAEEALLRAGLQLRSAKRWFDTQYFYAWDVRFTNPTTAAGVLYWEVAPFYSDGIPSDARPVPLTRQFGQRLNLAIKEMTIAAENLNYPTLTLKNLAQSVRGLADEPSSLGRPLERPTEGKSTPASRKPASVFIQDADFILTCGDFSRGRDPQFLRVDHSRQSRVFERLETVPVKTNFLQSSRSAVVQESDSGPAVLALTSQNGFQLHDEFFSSDPHYPAEYFPLTVFYQEWKRGQLIVGRHHSIVWGGTAVAQVWDFTNSGTQTIPAFSVFVGARPTTKGGFALVPVWGRVIPPYSNEEGELCLQMKLEPMVPGMTQRVIISFVTGQDRQDLEKQINYAVDWVKSHIRTETMPLPSAVPLNSIPSPAETKLEIWKDEIYGFFNWLKIALWCDAGTWREMPAFRNLWIDCDLPNAVRGLETAYLSTYDRELLIPIESALRFLISCQVPSGSFYSKRILQENGAARAYSFSTWPCHAAQCVMALTKSYYIFLKINPAFARECADAAIRGADWLIGLMDSDGSLFGDDSGPRRNRQEKNDYPGDIHGLVTIDLVEVYRLTGQQRYLTAAEKIAEYISRNASGLLANGNIAGGLCAVYLETGNEQYLESARRVIDKRFLAQCTDSNFQIMVAPQLDELDYAYRVWMLSDLARAERVAAEAWMNRQPDKAREFLRRSYLHLGAADWMAQTFFGVNANHRNFQNTSGGSSWGNAEVTGMEAFALAEIAATYSLSGQYIQERASHLNEVSAKLPKTGPPSPGGLPKTTVAELIESNLIPKGNLVSVYTCYAKSMSHRTGKAIPDSEEGGKIVWEAAVGRDTSQAYMVFGPYLEFEPGKFVILFRMKVLGESRPDEIVATIDAVVESGEGTLALRDISGSDFKGGKYVQIPLVFDYQGGVLECRVHWSGIASLVVDTITILKVEE